MILYEGIFFEETDLYSSEKIHLLRKIAFPHCTFKYRPLEEQIFDDLVGKEIDILVVGYGCDGQKSGFEIIIPEELHDYYINYDNNNNLKIPHITTSLNYNAKPVNTYKLSFTKLDKPFLIKGHFGYCIQENEKTYISYEKQKGKVKKR